MGISLPHKYREEGLRRGRASSTLNRAIAIDASLAARGSYPVYTLGHLASLAGVSWRYLREVVVRQRDPYTDIRRPKRNGGGTRAISSPEPVLLDVQRWILRNMLDACSVNEASFAYQRDRSIVRCAERHIGARWLIKLDIHDFFESVGERRVFSIFAGLGYSPLLSLELTRLCTRARQADAFPLRRKYGVFQDKAPYAVLGVGSLPQGAPTSGVLANAAMRSTDVELNRLANDRGMSYTRYSDDLTFSAGADFSRADAVAAIGAISAVVGSNGFRIHRSKTKIVSPGARHIVLGLLVDAERVRLLPEYKRRLEVHVRGVQRFGLIEHAEHRGFKSILSMVNHVDGGIAFAFGVEPEFAEGLRAAWTEALTERGFPAGLR